MQFVLMIYEGSTPLPGSDRWQGLWKTEQKTIYANYAELKKTKAAPWRSDRPQSTGNQRKEA
jgi:hypothetical protein